MESIFRLFRRRPPVVASSGQAKLLNGLQGHGARAAFLARFATNDGADWIALGASVAGRAKEASGRRCEDYCHFAQLDPGVVLLILADGAGSCDASAKGAEFVARFGLASALKTTLNAAAEENGRELGALLQSSSAAEWTVWARNAVEIVRSELLELATRRSIELESLSSTLIACALTANRLFVVHVGDGRGAYKTRSEGWRPLFEPVMGENAGETIFVASPFETLKDFGQFVRCHVHDESADEICLMSDGCEAPSFLTSIHSPEDGRYHRANIPFSGFLDAIRPFVRGFSETPREALAQWVDFVKQGSPKLKAETDDKTLIFALRHGKDDLP